MVDQASLCGEGPNSILLLLRAEQLQDSPGLSRLEEEQNLSAPPRTLLLRLS